MGLLAFCVVIMSVLGGFDLRKHREVLHYLAFSLWAVEYILIDIIYFDLYRFYRRFVGEKTSTVKNLRWNLIFGLISFAITVLSIALLATGELDFDSSLVVRLLSPGAMIIC